MARADGCAVRRRHPPELRWRRRCRAAVVFHSPELQISPPPHLPTSSSISILHLDIDSTASISRRAGGGAGGGAAVPSAALLRLFCLFVFFLFFNENFFFWCYEKSFLDRMN